MHGWDDVARAQDAALAGSGLANAAYFLGRARSGRRPRRFAALVLATVFAGVGLDGLAAALGLAPGGTAEVALGAPLLLGTAATSLLIASGGRR